MDGDTSRNRKRRRDVEGDEEKIKAESRKLGKKLPDQSVATNSTGDNFQSISDEIAGDEFRDAGIGVFDFPWIKEGLIFKADDYLDPEDNFDAYSYQHDEIENSAEKFTEKLCAFPQGDLREQDDSKLDEKSLWSSLQVDDLDSVDRIWSCVIDQPLQINVGLR